ncbi:MAG TPA: hypothetical protein VEA79_12685 [Phenylobacterium sp.]|nr:hypothetical protein [Phenylobacterium sp.]
MLRLSSLAAALVLAAAPAGAASVDPERISAHVRTLASDAFEGRGPGTAGEDKTIAYLTREFAAAGAQPGGRDGAWTQEVEMVRFTVSRPATPQIAGGACPASIGRSLIAWSRRSGGRVAVKDAPLVFVGFGVSAPDKQWDDFAGLDVRGKVAVVLTNDPDFAQATGPFRGADMTYYGRWSYKVEELARRVPVLFAGAGWDIADRLKNVRDPEVGARFHQPSDEWGEDLDFKAAAADMEVYRALLTRLANSDWWPGWKPGWEFGRPAPGAAAAS